MINIKVNEKIIRKLSKVTQTKEIKKLLRLEKFLLSMINKYSKL